MTTQSFPRSWSISIALICFLISFAIVACTGLDVSGVVFDDVNANGENDTELGIPGVMVTAYDRFGQIITQCETDANGTYGLQIADGDYPVRIEFSNFPEGYQPGPSGIHAESTVLFAVEDDSNRDLGLHRPELTDTIEVGNRVWADENLDGVQDPHEPPLAGVILGLYDVAGSLLVTTTTDASGHYLFNSQNVSGGLAPQAFYTIGLLENNFAATGLLHGYHATRVDQNPANLPFPEQRDSDLMVLAQAVGSGPTSSLLGIGVQTAEAGVNDHTWDMGLTQAFFVNTTDDLSDGTCDRFHCSLREAVNQANVQAGQDTIGFAIPTTGPHIIELAQGPLMVTDDLMVDGIGGTIDIQGHDSHRVWQVMVRLGLRIVTVRRGGIENLGHLELDRVTVADSVHEQGGAIYNQGMLTITNSTLSGNRAQQLGGALFNADGGRVTSFSSTWTNNQAPVGGGIANAGQVEMRNSIVAGNRALTAPDCYQLGSSNWSSEGYNLWGGDGLACGRNTDDLALAEQPIEEILLPLQEVDGTTWVHPLTAGSVARDGGNPLGCVGADGNLLRYDQRGELRLGAYTQFCDIGAFEAQDTIADLAVTKHVYPAQVAAGQLITYTLHISNRGPGIATRVVVTDLLPLEVQLSGVITHGLPLTTSVASSLTWHLPIMPAQASGLITVTGVVSPELAGMSTVLTNTAIISGHGDIATTNNVAQALLDVLVPQVSFSQPHFMGIENQETVPITIALNVPLMDPVRVTVASSMPLAIPRGTGNSTHTLQIAPGETTTVWHYPLLDDVIVEWDQQIALSLTHPVSAAQGLQPTATLTVIDDDQTVVQVTDLIVTEGQALQSYSISVTLSNPVAQDVTLTTRTVAGSALPGHDYQELTDATILFAAGSTRTQVAMVTIVGDAAEEVNETFQLWVDSPTFGGFVDTQRVLLPDPTGLIAIVDDDDAGVTIAPLSGITSEDGATQLFTATLSSQPTEVVTLLFRNTMPTEASVTPTLVFTPTSWHHPQIFTVQGLDDNRVDGDIPFVIIPQVESLDPFYATQTLPSLSITNLDNDYSELMVRATVMTPTVYVGDVLTYTVQITNLGTVSLQELTLVAEGTGAIVLPLTSLAPGEDLSVLYARVVISDDLPGPLVNRVTVTALPDGSAALLTAQSTTSVNVLEPPPTALAPEAQPLPGPEAYRLLLPFLSK